MLFFSPQDSSLGKAGSPTQILHVEVESAPKEINNTTKI